MALKFCCNFVLFIFTVRIIWLCRWKLCRRDIWRLTGWSDVSHERPDGEYAFGNAGSGAFFGVLSPRAEIHSHLHSTYWVMSLRTAHATLACPSPWLLPCNWSQSWSLSWRGEGKRSGRRPIGGPNARSAQLGHAHKMANVT